MKLKFVKMIAIVGVVSAIALCVVGCSGGTKTTPLPEAPTVSSAEEAATSEYLVEAIALSNEDFEQIGLDPEEDYAYWMSIKQMIDPDHNAIVEALYMQDRDYLESTKTVFDGITSIILEDEDGEYGHVNKEAVKNLQTKFNAMYDFAEPFCTISRNDEMMENLGNDVVTEENVDIVEVD